MQAGSRGGQHGEAQVCVVHRRYLHVVGMSPMAWRLRELVAAGAAPGWALHPVPPGRTPLDRLAEPLLAVSGAARFYNLLLRGGFATAEEVAATPDADLLLLRQVGPAMVAAVRQVLGDLGLGSPEDARPAPAGFMAERLTRITSLLAGPQRERYRDFAGMMARSSLPPGALTAIAESLSAEPVPAADPLVCLLLDTAGEAELAGLLPADPRPGARGPGRRLMPFAHSLPGQPGPRPPVLSWSSCCLPSLAWLFPRLPIAYSSVIDLDPSRLSHLGITNDHGQLKIAPNPTRRPWRRSVARERRHLVAGIITIAPGHDASYPWRQIGTSDRSPEPGRAGTSYYLAPADKGGEPPGRWQGGGLADLGFREGQIIEREVFERLYGEVPRSSRPDRRDAAGTGAATVPFR